MALIKCPECGHKLSEKANVCPECGCPVENIEIENEETPFDAQIFVKGTIPYDYNNVILTTKKSYLRKYLIAAIGYISITLGCVLFHSTLSYELYILLQTIILAYSSILFILFAMWEYNICNNLFAVNTFFPYYSSEICLAWLLPVVHLYKPYTIFKAAWKETDKDSKEYSQTFLVLWWSLESFSILALSVCIVSGLIGLKTFTSHSLFVFNVSSVLALFFRVYILYSFREKERIWIKRHRDIPYLTFI